MRFGKNNLILIFLPENLQKREKIIGRGKSPNNMMAKSRAYLEVLERLKRIYDAVPEAETRAGAAPPSTEGPRVKK